MIDVAVTIREIHIIDQVIIIVQGRRENPCHLLFSFEALPVTAVLTKEIQSED
jgi:hypothetical protein